jgi:hypothetical protein
MNTPPSSARARRLAPIAAAAVLLACLTSGLANFLVVIGHDPRAADQDGDGLPDSWELQHFDSLVQDGSADSDGDGITDAVEAARHTDPLCSDSDADGVSDSIDPAPLNSDDSDHDGLPDDWERHWLGTLALDGAADPDGDGQTATEEMIAATDPGRSNAVASASSLRLEVFRSGP